jgi:hypothetical protein
MMPKPFLNHANLYVDLVYTGYGVTFDAATIHPPLRRQPSIAHWLKPIGKLPRRSKPSRSTRITSSASPIARSRRSRARMLLAHHEDAVEAALATARAKLLTCQVSFNDASQVGALSTRPARA